ncbi:hypothetical protein JCM11641_003126 [Rhodosporidiobolus odoratus]
MATTTTDKSHNPASDSSTRIQRLYHTLHSQLSHLPPFLPQALKTCNRILLLDDNDNLAHRTKVQVLLALDKFNHVLEEQHVDQTERAYALYKSAREQDALDELGSEDEHDVKEEEARGRSVLRAQLHYRLGNHTAAQEAFDDLAATAELGSPELADLEANSTACHTHLSFLSSVPSTLSSLSVPPIENLESQPLSLLLPRRAPVASTSTFVAQGPEQPRKKRRSRPLPAKATEGAPPPAEDRWIPKRQRPSERDKLLQAKEKARGKKREKVTALMQGAAEPAEEKKAGTSGAGGGSGGKKGGGGKKKGKGKSTAVRPHIPPEHLRHPTFAHLESNLSTLPCFPTRGEDCVNVLYSPAEFYRTLLDKIRHAKERIFLASLYVGKEETELVATLRSSLRSNPSLRLTFLVDYLRSTREHPEPSSASLLASLHAAFPQQVELRLFHTPELSGWQRQVVPKRFNEGWGLQHMKVYGVDDEVILSGANLSHDYFTNRTDRYILFRHAPLAEYFSSLLSLFTRYSYLATATDTSTPHPTTTLSWPDTNATVNPFEDLKSALIPEFRQKATHELETFTQGWSRRSPQALSSSLPAFPSDARPVTSSFPTSMSSVPSPRSSYLQKFNTSLRPVLQMGPFSIRQETELVVPEIFQTANELATAPGGGRTTLDWTSGYFALRQEYRDLVIGSKAQVRVVSAAPEANGFHQSRGVSRFIPPAYTYFAQQFHEEVEQERERRKADDQHVEMREWIRDGWTYHAKGIWLAPILSNPYSPPAPIPSESFSPSHLPDPHNFDFSLRHSHPSPPFLTLVGSSNFGSRSATRDLEAGLLVTTHEDGTRWALEKEVRGIREYATQKVDRRLFEHEDREVPFGVRWAARSIEGML